MTGDFTNWHGCPQPERITLQGSHVTVVPLEATAHAKQLYDLVKDPSEHFIWDYMSVGPFLNFEDFEAQMKAWQTGNDPLFFTIIRNHDQMPVGAFSLLRITPKHGVIEIGWIWFTKELRKTIAATEALFLLSDYVLTTLGYRRYEWKCHNGNEASKQAARRLGFTPEGVFRQHMVLKGESRDTAWFAILDHEWPKLRKVHLQWLSPNNFDETGKQKTSLSQLIKQVKQ